MKLYRSPRKDTIPKRLLLPNSPFLELLQSGAQCCMVSKTSHLFAESRIQTPQNCRHTMLGTFIVCYRISRYIIINHTSHIIYIIYITRHTSYFIHHTFTSYIVFRPMQSHWIMFRHAHLYIYIYMYSVFVYLLAIQAFRTYTNSLIILYLFPSTGGPTIHLRGGDTAGTIGSAQQDLLTTTAFPE